METLTLVLKIDGKDKRFVAPDFINGKLFRQASAIAETFESGASDSFELDKFLQFVCDAYGNQFDVTELEEGIDARKMMKTIFGVVNFVIGNIEQASQLLATDSDSAEEKN